jgi:predicted HTH domain antitoxin
MNTIKIEMNVPESLTAYININDLAYQKKIQELMIYDLIKEDKISFGKAAEILEINKLSLITDLGNLGIPYFDCNIEDIKEDIENLKQLKKGSIL